MRTYVRVRSAGRTGDATILHADLDSFYASVEQRDDPDAARAAGDRRRRRGAGRQLRGQGLRRAHRDGRPSGAGSCVPHAVIVPPRMSAYSQASDAVFEVFRDTTPLVEPISIDEAFLDVGGLRRIVRRPGADRGAAAGAGSRAGRTAHHGRRSPAPSSWPRSPARKPNRTGCCWCRPDASWPSCIRCPSVGCGAWAPRPRRSCTRTASRPSLRSPNWARPRWPRWSAAPWAASCTRLSRNIDRRRVVTGVRRRSVGAQRALGRAGNTMSAAEVDAVVINLVDRITRRMRNARPDRTHRHAAAAVR